MKTFPKMFLYFLVTASLVVIGYTLSTGPAGGLVNYAYADSTGDSTGGDTSGAGTDDPPTFISHPNDFGGMFNERGFMKSNSTSFDDKEIVNDFNGNLMYQIPLAKGKGMGDLSYEVSLNYNGNVNHMITTADPFAENWTFGHLYQYNMTSPEWIISFNGLAVQMLNFETSYFTRPDPNSTAKGNYVRMLANGYQLTDLLNTTTNSAHDRITIMLGDGSTETLENTSDGYQGDYITKNKNSYLKAKVINGSGAGSLRTMYLMKGDGLTYIYMEYDAKYKDNENHDGMAAWFKPQIFLLSGVMDRFGHSYSFNYDSKSSDKIGRPWLTMCPGVNFTYNNIFSDNYAGIIAATDKGNYVLYTEVFGIEPERVHRPLLQKLVNPAGDQMTFDYQPYVRKGTNLYKAESSFFTVQLGESGSRPLYRLSKTTNYDGGIREYFYASDAAELEMNYVIQTGSGIHSAQDKYLGQGRDYFFTNMLSNIKVKDGANEIRSEDYTYGYYRGGSRTMDDVWDFPVDTTDRYTTTKIVSSLGSPINNSTPLSQKSYKTYRNYPVRGMNSGERTDYEGSLQLTSDSLFSGSSSTPSKILTYSFYTGNADNSHTKFDGKFLPRQNSEYFTSGSARRTWTFDYQGGGDTMLSQKTETDPLGKTTITDLAYFEKIDYRVFKYGSFRYGIPEDYDNIDFYLIQQPTAITVKNGSTVLQKKSFTYYDPETVTDSTAPVQGYPGQLQYEKDLNPSNNATLREITYRYCNQDSNGYSVRPPAAYFINAVEGNIKDVTDANGDVTKYYYELISHSEDALYGTDIDPEPDEYANPPRFTYHILKDNGVDSIARTGWNDYRLPSRIDQYVNSSKYISTYQNYDNAGNPMTIVTGNNFASTIDYDELYRANRITLPYDFNNTANDTIVTIDSTVVPFSLISNSTKWGFKDNLSTNYCYTYSTPFSYILVPDTLGWHNLFSYAPFSSYYSGSGAHPDSPDSTMSDSSSFDSTWFDYSSSVTQKPAIVKFDNSGFANITKIDSAFLEISPYFIRPLVNGSISNDYGLRLNPLKKLNDVSNSGCSGYNFSLSFQAGLNSLGFTGLNFTNDTTNCASSNENIAVNINNYRKLNITTLLRQNTNSNGLDLQGFAFDLYYTGHSSSANIDFFLNFIRCPNTNVEDWKRYASPKLIIYGTKTYYDTTRSLKYTGGTVNYSYDDKNNKVSVYSKIDKPSGTNRFKRVDNIFDGFGKSKESRIFYGSGSSDYNSYTTKYNYFDAKSKTTDPLGDTTMFSYDEFGSLSKTKNADTSSSLNITGHTTSLGSYFSGSYAGFVEIREYRDETGREFYKYFDAVGNLLRELKYVAGDGGGNIQNTDSPYDPDTTIAGLDSPGDVSLTTDYKYDALNRVIEVKTPDGKSITYGYDALGRVTSRHTVDAGIVQFGYDKNNNLTFSQDANQRAIAFNLYTARTYDGLNRLLTVADKRTGAISDPGIDSQGDTTLTYEMDSPTAYDSLYIINCYDTLSQSPVSSFNWHVPYDYAVSKPNNTKGALVATAYRTKLAEGWNYKFYRYDARGRVIKMWNKLDGMDSVKTIEYEYNSQNQVTNVNYESKHTDWKFFQYTYDDAGRLKKAGLLNPNTSGSGTTSPIPPPEDSVSLDGSGGISPWTFTPFAGYTYNQNQQIDTFSINNSGRKYKYQYNNRNWVSLFYKIGGSSEFAYTLQYNPNGNIRRSLSTGNYNNNFVNNVDGTPMVYIYDKSNRLVKASDSVDNKYALINNYDRDGNIVALKRYDGNGTQTDGFENTFTSGTNKLVSTDRGSTTQFTYDNNGNVTHDDINRNGTFVYDYRNLLTDIRCIKTEPDPTNVSIPDATKDVTYWTKYWYDEAGNRTHKQMWRYTGSEPDPVITDDIKGSDTSVATSGGGTWSKISDEFYIRDVSGKELAIYTGHNIEQWNMYGSDNVGKIDANNHRFFYLKDHLGTVRAVLDTTNTVIAANDYDAWGYPLVDRSYDASVTTQKYKFTGKERDNENNYDYFGARYYNSRVANWTSVDPLFEKHIGFSPYNYVLRSPLQLVDPDGKQNRPYLLAGDNPQEGWFPATENLNPTPTNTGKLDLDLYNPINIIASAATGGAFFNAVFGIRLTAGIVRDIAEGNNPKFGNKDVDDLYNKIVDFLGENAQGKAIPKKTPNGEVTDTYFFSKDGKRSVGFDINEYKPHDEPHIDFKERVLKPNGEFGKFKLWNNHKIWIIK